MVRDSYQTRGIWPVSAICWLAWACLVADLFMKRVCRRTASASSYDLFMVFLELTK